MLIANLCYVYVHAVHKRLPIKLENVSGGHCNMNCAFINYQIKKLRNLTFLLLLYNVCDMLVESLVFFSIKIVLSSACTNDKTCGIETRTNRGMEWNNYDVCIINVFFSFTVVRYFFRRTMTISRRFG